MAGAPETRWALIEDAFARALELRGEARAQLLSTSFPSDPQLRTEVERLLAAHDAAGDFLAPLDHSLSAALVASAPDDDEVLPAALGRYRVLRRIGAGAMGVVYLAHDPRLDRPVALKLLRGRRALDDAGARRLLEEARAASALDHPNVAAIHEVGETEDGRSFIAMAYCEGESLAARLARGPLPPREAALIARQLADALAAAHALGIVHRDVKPANIVVSGDGRVRLMDFGVAAVGERAAGGRAAGTPGYMSPEQLRGEGAAPASDVWSLGVILSELLLGRRPATPGILMPDARSRVGPRRLHPAGMPRRLAQVVEQCCAPQPEHRPAAATVASALQAFLQRSGARGQRRMITTGLGALVVVVALGAGWFALSTGEEDPFLPSTVAVLPFATSVPDAELQRIGRDLVVALSANLDGMGTMGAVDPGAVLAEPPAPLSASAGALAKQGRSLGAGAIIVGQVWRAGSLVGAAATVRDTRNGRVRAHLAAQAVAADVGSLADSLTLALFRSDWAEQRLPGTVAAAHATASIPALRAFLEGERAVAAGWFRLAPEAFARAMETDSTFWFAYWRYWFARGYHGSPVDSGIIAAVTGHRVSFPEPDRLLVEARLTSSSRQRLDLLRTITVRHPTSWPAWFELGDHLTHHGPYLGVGIEEARTALRRSAELNPNFVPALEHLFWTSLLERDTAETGQLLARFHTLGLDTLAQREWDLQPLDYYSYLDHLARSGGEPRAADTEIGARVLSGPPGAADPERRSATLLLYGFHRAQLALSRRLVELQPGSRQEAAHVWGSALAWAGRGGWDSAFAAARQFARASSHPRGPVWAYGLAATGAALGQLHPDSAALLAPLARRSDFGRSSDGEAEVAWLDGLLSCVRNQTDVLARQLSLLEASAAGAAPDLAGSLAALQAAQSGRRVEAGRALAQLERQNADRGWQFRHGAQHPFLGGMNRLAAAHWLLEARDTAAAAALLLLHESDLPGTLNPLPAANQVLGSFSLDLLASIEEGRGRTALARRYRAMLRERADLRPPEATLTVPCAAPAPRTN